MRIRGRENMRRHWTLALLLAGSCLTGGGTRAQSQQPAVPAASVTRKSIKAIGYQVGGGSTRVIFMGTSVAPQASGEAKVEAKKGASSVELRVTGMPQPTALG